MFNIVSWFTKTCQEMGFCCFFIRLIVLSIFWLPGVSLQEITLAPMTVDVVENSSVVLTCSLTGNVSAWNLHANQVWSLIYISKNETCETFGFINNSSLYSWNCNRNGSFSLTLVKINRLQHGHIWKCRQGLNAISNEVVINVKIPVENAEITSPSGNIVTLVENYYNVFICVTSYSRPTPSVKWFMRLEGKNIEINQISSFVVTSGDKGFQSARSQLNISVNREKLGTEIFCNGFNGLGTEAMSRTVTLNVLYPPSINAIPDKRVIEGSDVELTCPITYGNPAATSFIWTRELDDKRWYKESFTIHNVSRNDSMNYTCVANNTMVMKGNIRQIGSASRNTQLMVLYPPNKPSIVLISISDSEGVNNLVTDKLIVVEHSHFTLSCKANSLPMPNFYSWNQTTGANSSTLHISGLTRNEKDEITCHARNTMVSTEGTSMTGKNNITILIDILYSPDIGKIDNISSEEGKSVELSCPVINGNPNKTSVLWTRTKDELLWFGAVVTLKNISRTDSTTYTCRVNNTMISTGGFIAEGIISKTIELNVLYKALVRKYFVLDNAAYASVTIAENETVSLQCEIEGNPTPSCEINIDNNPDMEQYVNYSQNYATCYITIKASCVYDSVYTCKGSNVFNKAEYTEKKINVFVQCSPRPNPSVPTMDHVIAEVNTPTSLHFTALAYPKPISASWSKFVGHSWITVNESNNIRIYQSDLDFGITIIRVTNADIGKYQLWISNAIGSYIHIFEIEQKAASTHSNEPARTGLIIGLISAIIFIITIVSVILYRRKNQKCRETVVSNSYQNVSGAITQHIGDDKDYEQIGMNVQKGENTVEETNNFNKEIVDDNEISVTYEKLAGNRNDFNQYSQIHSMNETQTGTENGNKISFSSGEEERNAAQSNIYINMNI